MISNSKIFVPCKTFHLNLFLRHVQRPAHLVGKFILCSCKEIFFSKSSSKTWWSVLFDPHAAWIQPLHWYCTAFLAPFNFLRPIGNFLFDETNLHSSMFVFEKVQTLDGYGILVFQILYTSGAYAYFLKPFEPTNTEGPVFTSHHNTKHEGGFQRITAKFDDNF